MAFNWMPLRHPYRGWLPTSTAWFLRMMNHDVISLVFHRSPVDLLAWGLWWWLILALRHRESPWWPSAQPGESDQDVSDNEFLEMRPKMKLKFVTKIIALLVSLNCDYFPVVKSMKVTKTTKSSSAFCLYQCWGLILAAVNDFCSLRKPKTLSC